MIEPYQDVINEYGIDEPTIKYAVGVLTGHIIAGEKIKLACERHLSDLQRIKSDSEFHYVYDAERTDKIIKFSTLLVDLETHEPFKISPYEAFIVGLLEGWKEPETDGKRFDRAIISMARANGKTAVMALISLFNFLFGQPKTNRQLAVASADTAHADALFKYMSSQWANLAGGTFSKMAKQWGIEYNQREMRIKSQSTTMRKLSASSSTTSDGIGHFSYAVVDEYHLFKDRSFINSITSGQTFLPYSQTIFISTSGTDVRSPMFADYKRYSSYMAQKTWHEIDNILFLAWEQDNDDEAFGDPSIWQKSNPLFELESKRKSAIPKMTAERDELNSQGRLPDFLTKNMNRWQNAKENAFLPVDLLTQAIIPAFNMQGRDVYIGFDYSQTNDDTAIAFVFPYTDDTGNQKYHLYQHSFIPLAKLGTIEAKEQRDGINYRDVESKGFATITRDRFGLIDEDEVFNFMLSFIEKYDLNVKAILYDQWGTGTFIRRLDEVKNEYLIIPVRQGIKSLNEPTKFLQTTFIKSQITMLDDEAMFGALSNAVIVQDNNGIKIDKNTNSAKIDVADAIVNALFEGMFYFTSFTNAPDEQNKSPFAGMNTDEVNDYFMNDFTF
ncbi:terminase large subunit [Leuconostoc kimchii]|uniref:Terminase large subunit n=1 Tax=Leuconostoc kimchii TaxID=136609 RepID=A0ABX5SMJ4_9LACO|nr:terminase TerL endonuclease subunit [Leuconostoc kimchii]QBR47758.1 terminase large subunit [Leuconostoc kimchii]